MSDSTCRLTDSTFWTTSRSTTGKQLECVRKPAGEISHHLFYHGLWVVLEEQPIMLTDSRAADFGKRVRRQHFARELNTIGKEIAYLILDHTRRLVNDYTDLQEFLVSTRVEEYRALP